MSNLEQHRFSVRPNVIRNIGITLFVLSFLVPPGSAGFVPTTGEHFRDYLQLFWGCRVFIFTPQMVSFLPLFRGPPIDDGFTPYEIFIRVILIGAWLTNFTVLFRLPRLATLVAIALPWIAFIFWFEFMAEFIPFYFWALGITFIHVSKILRSWPSKSPESTAVGAGSSANAVPVTSRWLSFLR
jgi:hypothetical protein